MSLAATSIRPVRVFISTPDDLLAERKIIQSVIDELNNSEVFRNRCQLILYSRHERSASSQLQIPTDHYLLRPDAADIVICMLWLHLGTPHKTFLNSETGKPYQSLTEYEFFTAFRAYQETGKPYPLVYRCTRQAPDMKALDVTQYGRVQRFFERFTQDASLKDRIGEFVEPDDLKSMIYYDLSEILQDLDLQLLASPPATYVLPVAVPDSYVAPIESLALLRTALLGDYDRITLCGPEQGKTLLALAACEDSAVRSAFPDGILWATFGPAPEPMLQQRAWIQALGGSPGHSMDEAKAALKDLLQDRTMLLVFDDVCNAQDCEPLQAAGSKCRVLTISREPDQMLGTIQISPGKLPLLECRQLLIETSAGILSDESQLDRIIEQIGQTPLALRLVGILLANGATWRDMSTLIERSRQQFNGHPHAITLALIKASIDALDEEERTRYQELVVFPAREALIEMVIARLWSQTGKLDEAQVLDLLAKFQHQGLIQADNTLSDLHHEVLQRSVPALDRSQWHGLIAASYQGIESLNLQGRDLEYGWRRVAYHLAEANQIETLRALLSNYAYLRAKIERMSTALLIRDFLLLPVTDPLQRLADALRLGTHVLDHNPHELANQLYGRIGALPDLHHEPSELTPRLRLTSSTLTPPGWPLVRKLEGHTFWVHGCALSPDGITALSASADHTLRVWDIHTGKCLRLLRGHLHWVTSCVFSADGQLALSGSADRTLQLWDVKTAKMLRTFQGHEDKINSCALSADGQIALSASTDRSLRVWNVKRATVIRVLEGHVGEITGCALSPDGNIALSSSVDGTLRLWDVNTGDVIHMLEGHENSVTSCALSHDGRLALSGSGDNTLRLWDAHTGLPMAYFEGHSHWVLGCALSHDGHLAMSVSIDGTVRLWDTRRARTLRLMQGPGSALTSCALSPDGRTALSASADNTLQLWDASGWQIMDTGQWQVKPIGASAYSPDGRLALSASIDNTLWLWNTSGGHIAHSLQGHTDVVTACIFSPDGCRVLSASADHTLRVWDSESGQTLYTLQGHGDVVTNCALSRDGMLALSTSADCTLRLWNLRDGAELTRWTADAPLYSCAFSPDANHVIAGELSGSLHFLRMENLPILS